MYILKDTVTGTYYYYTIRCKPRFGKARKQAARIKFEDLDMVVKHLNILCTGVRLVKLKE